MRWYTAFIATGFILGCTEPASNPSALSNTQQMIVQELDERVPALLAEYHVPAAGVALIEDNRIIFAKVYGQQGPGVPATNETLFNVASLTKPVTLETILRLIAAGEISLDEPMSDYWIDPDIAEDDRHELLTPRIALSHQTGFPNWRDQLPDMRLGFIAEPGTEFTYSGEGYNYVARFAEKKLGRDFESLAQEYVFDPAGMTSTSYSARDWMEGRNAVPATPSGSFTTPMIPAAGQWDAANNLSTTIGDYALFALDVLKGEGMTSELAAERLRLYRSTAERAPCELEPKSLCPSEYGMALGWERFDFPDGPVMMHLGGNTRPDGSGEATIIYYYPGQGRAVVVLLSGRSGEAFMDIVDIVDPDWPLGPFFRSAQ